MSGAQEQLEQSLLIGDGASASWQRVSCLQAGSRYPRAAWTLASSEVARRNALAVRWFGLSLLWTPVRSLVRKLRSHMADTAKKETKKKLLGIKRQAGLVWLPAPRLLSPAWLAVCTQAQLDSPARPALMPIFRPSGEAPLHTVNGEQPLPTAPSGCHVCCEVKRNQAASSLAGTHFRAHHSATGLLLMCAPDGYAALGVSPRACCLEELVHRRRGSGWGVCQVPPGCRLLCSSHSTGCQEDPRVMYVRVILGFGEVRG